MSCLPRPPAVLRHDSYHPWNYDSGQDMFSFFARMTEEENNECVAFEAQFKNFMYGGVSVQRLIPDSDGGKTGKERRTLWLMLPEVGSLRLGFVSKLSDGKGRVRMTTPSRSLQKTLLWIPQSKQGTDLQ
jgi:hypothetical protein